MNAHTEIPSENDFAEWEKYLDEKPADGLLNDLPSDENFEEHANVFRKLFVAAEALSQAHANRAEGFTVIRWIEAQDSYQRAVQLRRGRRSQSEYVSRPYNIERCEENIARVRRAREAGNIRARLYFPSNEIRDTWRSYVIRAIGTYLYSDDTELQISMRKELLPLLGQAEKLAEQMRPLLERFSQNGLGSFSGASQLLRGLAQIPRLQSHIGRLWIDRKSERARERYFVFMMYRANHGWETGEAQPEVIAEMMTLPIFAAPFDTRHIARLCSEFRKRDREEREAYWGQKIANNRENLS